MQDLHKGGREKAPQVRWDKMPLTRLGLIMNFDCHSKPVAAAFFECKTGNNGINHDR